MLDRVTGMQVFSRVAALGSLSAAARALGMSQTMATKHIAAIEERLGVRLLLRTTRKLTLTEAGRRYLESVERILGEVEEAEATAAAISFWISLLRRPRWFSRGKRVPESSGARSETLVSPS